jgi:hypothetical protein
MDEGESDDSNFIERIYPGAPFSGEPVGMICLHPGRFPEVKAQSSEKLGCKSDAAPHGPEACRAGRGFSLAPGRISA